MVEPAELLTDGPGARIELLADTEGLGATRVRLGGDAQGPPPHVHRLHADCFLVLDGAVRLHVAGEERVVEAESWIQLPSGVVHTFAPANGRPVRYLNVHTPSCGFGPYMRRLAAARSEDDLRRAREGFDQHSPTGDVVLDPAYAVVSRLGGGEGETVVDRPGRRVTLLADTEEIAVTESIYGPGERGPDLHVHHEHTDAWFLLEGSLVFELRDGLSFEVGAGTAVVVPPDVVHGFANEGEARARFLNLHAPSCGFGDYMRGQTGFDQHPVPTDGGRDPGLVVVRTFGA